MAKTPKTSVLSDENLKDDSNTGKPCFSCKMTTKPCACGAPSKIGKFTEALGRFLDEGMNALICTDKELILVVNKDLPEEERVAEDTFITWKTEGIKDERCQAFRQLYALALWKQKQDLFKSFKDESTWQKWAWLIERKFTEWNLKGLHEIDDKRPNTIEKLLAQAAKDRAAMEE